MFCESCGQKNEEGSRFCRGCGRPLDGAGKRNSKSRRFLTAAITLVVIAGGGYGAQQYLSEEIKQSIREMVTGEEKKVQPVAAEVVEKKEVQLKNKKEKVAVIKETQQKVYTVITDGGFGSGFLFTKGGTVVTNAHVVAGYTDVLVRDVNGQEYAGRVIGISDVEDIALIQVADFQGENPLPAEMHATDVGTEVIALGSPNGFENSASIGYLTGIDRDIIFDFEYEDIYQIDAQIAPGSSGGPLIDAETGKVIGINSLLYTDGNAIGFSIPLHSVYDSLIAWEKNPMSETQVASLFGVYDDYAVYNYKEEDYAYEEDDSYVLEDFIYDYEEEPVEENTDTGYEENVTDDEEIITEESPLEEETEESYVEEEVIEEEGADSGETAENTLLKFDEMTLGNFVSDYRSSYEMALASEDFAYVQNMLLFDSAIYYGIADYINEITGQGMQFEFREFSVTGIEILENHALVHTYEAFDFMSAAGDWTLEERNKTYTVVQDSYGAYFISDISNN